MKEGEQLATVPPPRVPQALKPTWHVHAILPVCFWLSSFRFCLCFFGLFFALAFTLSGSHRCRILVLNFRRSGVALISSYISRHLPPNRLSG